MRVAQRCGANWPARLSTAADSSASSVVIGGRIPAKRCASIDLPVPGGPTSSSAVAAGRGDFERSPGGRLSLDFDEIGIGRRRQPHHRFVDRDLLAVLLARFGTQVLHDLNQRPGRVDRQATDQRRFVGALPRDDEAARRPRPWSSASRHRPSRGRRAPDATPRTATVRRRTRTRRAHGSAADRSRRGSRARSAGRSVPTPSAGRRGARLTVMRRIGKSNRLFCSAARTRSRASRTSVSGRPTSVNDGSPFARWTSTVTSGAAMPFNPRLRTTASVMGDPIRAKRSAFYEAVVVGGRARCRTDAGELAGLIGSDVDDAA